MPNHGPEGHLKPNTLTHGGEGSGACGDACTYQGNSLGMYLHHWSYTQLRSWSDEGSGPCGNAWRMILAISNSIKQ